MPPFVHRGERRQAAVGIGSILAHELAADARAAGITELVATVCGDNPAVVSLLRRIARSLRATWHGGEREFVLALEGSPAAAPCDWDTHPVSAALAASGSA